MSEYKRDFNKAAKILLGLSMFAVGMTIVNSILIIKTNSYFGVSNSILIAEISFDVFILAASVLTFMKKRYGLIALIILFVARMFATIPTGGDIAYSYHLGGKMALFFRDFGLFAIAMCFKKNGVSGWKSFFSSPEIASEQESISSEDTSRSTPTYVENNLNNELNKAPVSIADTKQNEIKDFVGEKMDKSKRDSLVQGHEEQSSKLRVNKIVIISVIVVAVILIAGFVSIGALKSYPKYIRSFGDKFKYSMNLANDSLANKLYNEAMSTRKYGFFVMKEDGKWQMVSDWYIYPIHEDIIDNYDITEVYYLTDTLKSVEDIVDNAIYVVCDNRYCTNNIYVWDSGRVKRNYATILEEVTPAPSFMLATPYDIKGQQKQEKELMDYAASVPVKDAWLAENLARYYLIQSNYNRAIDILSTTAKKSGGDPKILSILSIACYDNEDFEQAKKYAQKAVKKNPKEYQALSVLYEISIDNGECESVKKEAKKAIDYGAEDPDIYYCYAEALYKLDERKEARSAYNKGNDLGFGRLHKKYAEAGGSPYDFLFFEFSFKDYDGKILTDYGKKLYSNKSKYICPRAKVKIVRGGKAVYQCKLYYNGELQTNIEHSTYTYDTTIDIIGEKSVLDVELNGWGSNSAGTWQSGNYRFEVWFDGEKVGSEEFHIY